MNKQIYLGHGGGLSILDESKNEVYTLLKGVEIKGVSYDHADDVLWIVDISGNVLVYDILKQRFLKQITNAGIGAGDSISVNSGIALAGGATKAVTRALGYISIADTIAPNAPEDISAVGGLGRVTIQWSRPNAEDIDHYKVIVKDETDTQIYAVDNIYTEHTTFYNQTRPRTDIAKTVNLDGTAAISKYWQVQVIVYDVNGNSSQSTWVTLDERTSGSGWVEQNAYLENYLPATGAPASSASELLAALSSITNGNDSDINITFNYAGISDVSEIEKLILQRQRQSDSAESAVVEIPTQANSFSGAPTSYHDTNLLNETGTGSAANETFKYRLVAISHGGMITIGTWSAAVNCTDTTGQDVSTANITGAQNVGSVFLQWTDVIDKNGALYEIYRSPNNTWTTLNTNYEKIATIPSSRAANTEVLSYQDNDWDNITGKIPNDKTDLADGSYDGRVAYYRLVGVDRFGNRYDVSDAAHTSTTGALSSQYYAPAIPVDDTCVALFPFSDGIVSTKGHVPKNTNIPQVYLRNDGKWGGGCISMKTAPEDILEYATNMLKDGNMENPEVLNWNATPVPVKSTDKYFQGSQSLKLPSPASTLNTTQSFATIALADYYFDSWCYIDTGDTLIITLTGDTSATTSSIAISGYGNWQRVSFVFRTGTGDTSTTLKFTTNAGNSGSIYIDYSFVIQSLVANGGFEGTYVSGLAPNWVDAKGTGALAEEGTIVHSGSKSQKITALADGEGVTQQLSGLTVSNIYYLSGWLYNTIGKSKIVCDGVTAFQTNTGAWDRVDLVFAATTTNPIIQVFSSGGAATFYIDDIQVVSLTGFNKDDRILKYDASLIPVTGFAIDFFVRHSWDADDGITHFIFDTTGEASNKNRFYFEKDSGNNLHYVVYGDTVSGYKQVYYSVTESNFVKNTLHRITIKFDASTDTIKLYLNGTEVGSASSGGTWADPTTWGSYLFVGGKNDNTPGDVEICQFSIWNEAKEAVVIQTWNDVDTAFVDNAVPTIPGIANPTDDHLTSEVDDSQVTETTEEVS